MRKEQLLSSKRDVHQLVFKDCKYLSWRFWNYGTDISVLGVTPVKWRKVIERITET